MHGHLNVKYLVAKMVISHLEIQQKTLCLCGHAEGIDRF